MRGSGERTKARILEAAYGLFYRHGFGRVSMDAIADAAGLTKRTLYQHFDSKDALAAATLDRQQERALRLIRGWTRRPPATPEELVAGVFDTMELADLPGHPARLAARRHKRAVEAWIGGELARMGVAEAGERAREVALLMEGCLSLILIHGDPGYAAAAGRAARRLVAGRGGGR
jgi:AcrR family transcriptional regulator